MPSSSEEVATRQRSSPAFSRRSTSCRFSRETLPWWERAISPPACSFKRSVSRSQSLRLFVNRMQVAEPSIRRKSLSRIGCQMRSSPRPIPARSATVTARDSFRSIGLSIIVTGRREYPSPTSSSPPSASSASSASSDPSRTFSSSAASAAIDSVAAALFPAPAAFTLPALPGSQPPRNCAMRSIGFCVADTPIR